ncbi:MAG: DUF4390 domain-containing protein [Pseudomonadota bacterium]
MNKSLSKALCLIFLSLAMNFGTIVSAKNSAIEVNYFNIAENNNELRLDAEIIYELNSEVREALINGISLMFQVEVQVITEKNWRWDKVVSSVVKTYVLRYHALSKQYVLESLETGDSDSYPDLQSVLAQQGRVSAMYIAETEYLKDQENYIVQLRARMLSNKLPLPLRMKSYFSPKWRLSSGWYKWPL